jgi:hypothetical protein
MSKYFSNACRLYILSSKKVLLALLYLFAVSQIAVAADFLEDKDLVGTVWLADTTHDRTTIDRFGAVSIKTGKDIYLQFIDEDQGVFTVKIHWWNVEENINVVEFAVMVREAENFYQYVEAEHPDDSTFPGIAAGGTFVLLSEWEASLSQIGRLLDGSASAFVTRLQKVDNVPDVPIQQTYPPTQ